MTNAPRQRAFTLIELLVVITIIGILTGIILPSIRAARETARASACSSNLRSVGQGMSVYQSDFRFFPPGYVYGNANTLGTWQIDQQVRGHPMPINGYVHWSYLLLGDDNVVAEGGFTCPASPKGGAPAINPGPEPQDWDTELGQVNDLGQSTPSQFPKDRQARRMAYTGNAAILPRNKFNVTSGRRNHLVSDALITQPAKTILATEFVHTGSDWGTVFSDNRQSRSHRPITPFRGRTAGDDVYDEPDPASPSGNPSAAFEYPSEADIMRRDEIGPGAFGQGSTGINAVGRSHPSPDRRIGGSANFLFIDGHVDRMTVLQSVQQRLWGDKFYSLTGRNTTVGP